MNIDIIKNVTFSIQETTSEMGDSEIRERARLFTNSASRAIDEVGDSYDNFRKFVDLLRQRESPRFLSSKGS